MVLEPPSLHLLRTGIAVIPLQGVRLDGALKGLGQGGAVLDVQVDIQQGVKGV